MNRRANPLTRFRNRLWHARFPALCLMVTAILRASAPALASEPVNLGELKARILAYVRYGGYERDLESVDQQARTYVEMRAKTVKQPALVLDVDETALSNWPEVEANDFAFFPDGPCDRLPAGPCGDAAWERLGQAKAIAPTLALFRAAKAAGVTVVFITGRDGAFRAATEANLRDAGYSGWLEVIMRPRGSTTESAADYKTAVRKRLEDEGYRIIANVGDQPSDLAGGHAERAFLLPNPFYRIP